MYKIQLSRRANTFWVEAESENACTFFDETITAQGDWENKWPVKAYVYVVATGERVKVTKKTLTAKSELA